MSKSEYELSIGTYNTIYLDGEFTPFHVRQTQDSTEVYHQDTNDTLPLPETQYSTAAERPACGNGRTKFYNDFKKAYTEWKKASA